MFAYDDLLAAETPAAARSRFEQLSASLAAPTNMRVYPQENVAWLADQQLLEMSADICEDLVRRSQFYDDEGPCLDLP